LILSNSDIIRCLDDGDFFIGPLDGKDPSQPPFNTSAIDLRLGNEILLPSEDTPVQLDLRKPGIAKFIGNNSSSITITDKQPYELTKGEFVLGKTLETVDFPIHMSGLCYSARVEGKSSIARCGVLIHFTAPTIHAGFPGTITLEILNMGAHDFLLYPNMYICQLIIEEVRGKPIDAPSQFKGQTTAAGVAKKN